MWSKSQCWTTPPACFLGAVRLRSPSSSSEKMQPMDLRSQWSTGWVQEIAYRVLGSSTGSCSESLCIDWSQHWRCEPWRPVIQPRSSSRGARPPKPFCGFIQSSVKRNTIVLAQSISSEKLTSRLIVPNSVRHDTSTAQMPMLQLQISIGGLRQGQWEQLARWNLGLTANSTKAMNAHQHYMA